MRMQTVLFVAVGAALLGAFLKATAPERPAGGGAIVAIAAPAQAYVGEKVSVRGVAVLDGASEMVRRFHVCDVAGAACRTTGWGDVAGPGRWSGFAGDVLVDEPGAVRIEWSLYDDWGADARRAVARYAADVVVVAAPR